MVHFFGLKEMIVSIFIFFILVFLMKFKYKKNNYFLFFFTILYIYIVYTIKKTLFPIYNTEFERLLFGPVKINWIPLKDSVNITSILNVIMTIPFGFFVPLLVKGSLKKIALLGFLFSLLIELSQLAIALVVGYSFRVVDVNDLIFNTIGSVFGYTLFVLFSKTLRKILKNSSDNLVKYILDK